MENKGDTKRVMDFQKIVTQIDALPPLSDVAQEMREIYAQTQDEINITQLARAIASDAALSANVLKAVNAPYYGFSKKITSVLQAITLFGTQMIYAIVMKFAMEKALVANLRPYGISASQLNEISHLQSRLVMQWYSTIELNVAQDIASLALMMESGKLVVAKEVVKSGTIKTFLTALEASPSVLEHELAVFQSSSYYIAGLLFDHWNFEPLYGSVLKGLDFEVKCEHPQYDTYIKVLDVVRHAVNIRESLSTNSIKEACEVLEDYKMPTEHFVDVAKSMKKYVKES